MIITRVQIFSLSPAKLRHARLQDLRSKTTPIRLLTQHSPLSSLTSGRPPVHPLSE